MSGFVQQTLENAFYSWVYTQLGATCPVIWEGMGAKPSSASWGHMDIIAGPTITGHPEGTTINAQGERQIRCIASCTLSVQLRGEAAMTAMQVLRTSLYLPSVLASLRSVYSLTPRGPVTITNRLQPRETDFELVVAADFMFALEFLVGDQPGFIDTIQAQLALDGSSVPVEAP